MPVWNDSNCASLHAARRRYKILRNRINIKELKGFFVEVGGYSLYLNEMLTVCRNSASLRAERPAGDFVADFP